MNHPTTFTIQQIASVLVREAAFFERLSGDTRYTLAMRQRFHARARGLYWIARDFGLDGEEIEATALELVLELVSSETVPAPETRYYA